MLTWLRETYAATAADAAGSWITRLWTPDKWIHDPGSTGKLSRREDWLVHAAQVIVLATTTGLVKPGVIGSIIRSMDYAGSYEAVQTGVLLPNDGLRYDGRPFIATHGVGWQFYKGALADTDKVLFRILYEPVKGAVA